MNLVLTCVLSEFVTHDIFVAACFLLLQSTCDSCCCLFLVFFCHMVLIQVKRKDPLSQVVFPCDRRSQEETVGWPCEEEDKRLFPCERRSQAETVVSPCGKRQFATCVS
ncbi:hypothetical protein Bca101_004525 [Brassica carinata]